MSNRLFTLIANLICEFIFKENLAFKVYHEGYPSDVASKGLSTFPVPKSAIFFVPLKKENNENEYLLLSYFK